MGFTMVVALEQFPSAEANVTNESSTLATMYRQTVSLPAAEQTTMRKLLRQYTEAVQAQWDSPGSDTQGTTARSPITDMYRVLGNRHRMDTAAAAGLRKTNHQRLFPPRTLLRTQRCV
jgi:hypothetical protein